VSAEHSSRWLAAVSPFVQAQLPPPPARVVELGCGSHGGFVPRLLDDGYEAVGVDPQAPEGPAYQREKFERADLSGEQDAFVACTSLHHVGDPALVLDRISKLLRPGGALVVVELDWDRFDERTARWCFERLDEEGDTWLHRLRDRWAAGGGDWAVFLARWARDEGVHGWAMLESLLDSRFERRQLGRGPCFFADLEQTSVEEEQGAIDAGDVAAIRIDYAARRT
jgi:SAM-dependent methyltransferase